MSDYEETHFEILSVLNSDGTTTDYKIWSPQLPTFEELFGEFGLKDPSPAPEMDIPLPDLPPAPLDFRPIVDDLSLAIDAVPAPTIDRSLDRDYWVPNPPEPMPYQGMGPFVGTSQRLNDWYARQLISDLVPSPDTIDEFNKVLGYTPKLPEWLNQSA